MKLRPSPALVVAVLAVVVAMAAGTSYAASQITSAQIKNNSIKSKDIKDNQVNSKDVKDSSLTGADIADGGLTGADVKDGSLTSADLDRSCPSTTAAILGACVDKTAVGPVTFNQAEAACNARHARLMSANESDIVISSGLTWTNGGLMNYEFTSEVVSDGSALNPIRLDHAGHVYPVLDKTTDTAWYRCVTAP